MGVEKVGDMVGTNILDWIHPDYYELLISPTRKVIEESLPGFSETNFLSDRKWEKRFPGT